MPARATAAIRTITKLVAGTGIVTFDVAPAAGEEVTADFESDVPVRFDVAVTIETCRLHDCQQIRIVELGT